MLLSSKSTRQTGGSSLLGKKLQRDDSALQSTSLDSLYKDLEWVVECAQSELLEALKPSDPEDMDADSWQTIHQSVVGSLTPISGSATSLVARVVEELQLSLREKLKAHDAALEAKLDRSRKAAQLQLQHAEADFRGRQASQLEIEQKIVERVMSAVTGSGDGGDGGDGDGEQGKILAEAFERQAQLLTEISQLTSAVHELRAANANEVEQRTKAEAKAREATGDLQRSEDDLAHYQMQLARTTEALDRKTDEFDALQLEATSMRAGYGEYKRWAEAQLSEMAQVKAKLAEDEQTIERLEAKLRSAHQSMERFASPSKAATTDSLTVELTDIDELLAVILLELDELRQAKRRWLEEQAEQAAHLERLSAELRDLQATHEAHVAKAAQTEARLTRELDETRRDLATTFERAESLRLQLETTAAELGATSTALGTTRANLEGKEAECAAQAAQIASMRANYEASAREHLTTKRALEAELAAARQELRSTREELRSLSAKVTALWRDASGDDE